MKNIKINKDKAKFIREKEKIVYIEIPKIKFDLGKPYLPYKSIDSNYYYIFPVSRFKNKFDDPSKYIISFFKVYNKPKAIFKFFKTKNNDYNNKFNLIYSYYFVSFDECEKFYNKYESSIGNNLRLDTNNEFAKERKKTEFYQTLFNLAPALNIIIHNATFFEKINSEGVSGFIFVNTLKSDEPLPNDYYKFVSPKNSDILLDKLFQYTLCLLKEDYYDSRSSSFYNDALEAFINSAKFKAIQYKNKKKNKRIEFLCNFTIIIIIGGIYLYIFE